jgi:hypothetical protein
VLEGGRVAPERVEVGHHQVERLDVVIGHVLLVGGVGAVGQQPPVDLGVQRHHAVPEDGREPRHLLGVGHLQPRLPQGGGGAAGGDEVPPELGQSPGQIDDAGLVIDRDQDPHVPSPRG